MAVRTSGLTVVWRLIPLGEGWPKEDQDEVVWVNISKLDESWKLDDGYVGKDGEGSKHEGRYNAVGRYIESGGPLFMPVVSFDNEGVVGFTDGRHRVAWLRDRGAKAIAIAVPSEQAAEFRRRFGTNIRQTMVVRGS